MEIIKHLRTFTVVIILPGLISAGCSHLEQKTSDNTKGINTLEEKINALENLENKHNDLAKSLNETREEISRKLAAIEEDKNKIETRLEELASSIKEAEQKSSVTEVKGASYTLSEKAIESYSQEKFEDAIAQWKEALKNDPTNLEAKFNIEITKDRLKVKEIQDDLKALRLQKGKAK